METPERKISGRWIRADVPVRENEYHEFAGAFGISGNEPGKILLQISSETEYAAYINGKPAAYGQYPDLRQYKVYDEIDITPLVKEGKNVFAAIGYFAHTETSGYTEKGLGLWFQIVCGDRVLCRSGRDTLSRLSRAYKSGEMPLVTMQLGYSYHYDFTAEDDWRTGAGEGFRQSLELSDEVRLYPRPTEKLREKKNTSRVIRVGEYDDVPGARTGAEEMQRAKLRERSADFLLPAEEGIDLQGESGRIYFLADTEDERAGLLAFDVEVPEACALWAGYGEHLADGRVRTEIGERNFQLTFRLKAGRNRFIGPFRRLGGRYLCAFLQSPAAKVYVFGILSADYPVREKPTPALSGKLQQEIYAAGVKTLKVCMHEHYEDTPWREQALYAMDSYNQMLCGYCAFEGFGFARASLKLMSENLRPDGFFTLTTPRTRRTDDLTIPCFSLVQICAMEEYVRRSGDVGFFAEYEENYRAVTENFLSRREKNGLLKAVKGKYYWNFYEWSEGLEGNFFEEPEDRYELPLNAFFVVALRAFAVLEENAGKDGKEYRKAAEDSSRALEAFFDEERGCYADFMDKGGNLRGYSELSNALAALVSAQEEHRKKALESLAERGTLTHDAQLQSVQISRADRRGKSGIPPVCGGGHIPHLGGYAGAGRKDLFRRRKGGGGVRRGGEPQPRLERGACVYLSSAVRPGRYSRNLRGEGRRSGKGR